MVPLTLYWSPDFAGHQVSPGHPESPSRLQAIRDFLERTGQWARLPKVEARTASLDEVAWVHTRDYLQQLDRAIQSAPAIVDGADTEVSTGSMTAALKMVGGGFQAVDDVMSHKSATAFILGRPPGHHALPTRAMGFCLFANIALAASYAQKTYGVERIAIIDWDVHHGNGTQDIFYESDRVYYLSVHEYPLYPGTGRSDEQGTGQGRSYNRNFPLSAQQDDDDYLRLFEGPLAETILDYGPELILVSAGFDAHERDPLAHMCVSTEGFNRMTEVVMRLAGESCEGRIVSFLEGGYDPAGLAESVSGHLAVLANDEPGIPSTAASGP